ncbi:RecA family protein [Tunturiibacter lichenicola]|uniref:recombinase RecA n=1 Tax=Tunturiibacter lichenicola TaxID=2051959 RepID=UPI0028C40A7B|nr:recombinase RecA [Edaphobacter lichenicola]
MSLSSAIRAQVESSLARKIPSALTPVTKMMRSTAASGIASLDDALKGGFPIGALSELSGPECSGRTSLAHSFVARVIESGKIAAWIDVSDTFDAVSAAAAGIDLQRLLWVRCGVTVISQAEQIREFSLPDAYLAPSTPKKGLHGGGCGTHPRHEAKGLSSAVTGLLQLEALNPRCAETQRKRRAIEVTRAPIHQPVGCPTQRRSVHGPYQRIEQGLKSADLILQAGGFGTIVLDLGSIAPEYLSRIDLATWHRYRVAAERTQSSIVLLTQYVCAKSSAELHLRLHPADILREETTVFSGTQLRVEVVRHRFQELGSNVLPIRKPPQSANVVRWRNRATWAGQR